MGSNKKNRKQAQAEVLVITLHEDKIAKELGKDLPDMGLIRKWQKDIDRHQKRLEVLLSRLPQGRKQ